MPRRFLFALLLSISALKAELTLAESKLIDVINGNMMEAHVSFLASDLLEGRDTPSRGLELAETYIAAQFRRLGLQSPTGDGKFFQNVPYLKVTQPMSLPFDEAIRSAALKIHRRLNAAFDHLTRAGKKALELLGGVEIS